MDASERIDLLIEGLTDWRGKIFAAIRKAILEADREISEEWKWRGTPVWSRHGIIAVANPHKGKVKLTFVHGAKLPDPDKFFNTGLGGNQWRATDFLEGDKVDTRTLKTLVRAAITFNQLRKQKPARGTRKAKVSKTKRA